MKSLVSTLLILSSLSIVAQSFEEKVTSASNVRIAVTNVGTFGNAFRGYRDGTSNESCEFPAGSGVEHLFESGIWIGAERGGSFLVSTAAVDAPQGYQTGSAGFEFTTRGTNGLVERSSFKDSPFFSPLAVSHQDYVADFTDKNLRVPGTQTPIVNHLQPLYVDVQLRTYNFNFAFSDYVVFVDMDIVNTGDLQGGANVLDSVYFGLWANTVVRNINVTPPGTGGAAFYNKGGNGYIDSMQMAFCYDYAGDIGFTNSYVAQKFLGATDKYGFHHPKSDTTFAANYNVWGFNDPGTGLFQQPLGATQQFQRLSRGVEDEPCWDVDNGSCGGGTFQEQLNNAGNRSDLVSVGPFRNFEKGDTISISYAFILAPKLNDGNANTANTPAQMAQLIEHAGRSQTAFYGEDLNENGILDPEEDKNGDGKITRFILPSPPDIPNTRIEVANNQVDIYWSNNSEFSIDPITQTQDFEGYRIYLTKLGFDVTGVPNLLQDLIPIDEFDIKDNGFANEIGLNKIRLANPIYFDGDTTAYFYKYTIPNLLNGWQYAVALSAFDTGNSEQKLESLESSLLANNFRVFAGELPTSNQDPYVYPNPYYFGSSWEGTSNFQEQSRKLIFANLPQRCKIQIFTPAGDLIDEIYHDEKYQGEDIRWFETFGSENLENNKFSGGEHAWDLLSSFSQIISRGVYVYTVENLSNGEVRKGKFTILK